MSFLGDVGSFESFNLGEMLNKLGKDPERAFIGAGDPFSSSVWGSILGKDYEPIVDQYGGASSDTYDKAKAAGINTGPGATMHGIARAITSAFAGGAGAGALGGGASAAGGAAGGVSGGTGLTTAGAGAAEGMGGGTGLLSSSAGEGLQAGAGAGSSLYPGMAAAAPASSPFSTAMGYAKQGSNAMQAASMAKGLLSSQPSHVQPSPIYQGQNGSTALQQLAAQNQQTTDQELAQAAQQRMARRQMYRGGM